MCHLEFYEPGQSSSIRRLMTTDDPGSFLAAFLTSVEIEASGAYELTGVSRGNLWGLA
jgi:hypothetical protein